MLARLSTVAVLKPALGGLAVLLLALSLNASPAAARGAVFFGFDFAGPPLFYYPPPYYYYPPPPAVVYGPPVYYYPPPPAPATAPPPASNSHAPAAPAPTASGSTYQTPSGQTCREYQTQVTVDGRQQPGHGTACLQPDGTWRMVD